jgi:hypothetical protein
MFDIVSVLVPVLFAILGLAVITWVIVIFFQLPENAPRLWHLIKRITDPIFSAAPFQNDIKQSDMPVQLVVGRLIPLIFWLLIVLPMVIFPIILIIMPLLGIPWSYLLPPVP